MQVSAIQEGGWLEEGQAVEFDMGQRRAAHNTSACCMEADPGRLNRRPQEQRTAAG